MRTHLSLIFLLLPMMAHAVPGKVLGDIPAPGPCPTGLAFDGDAFWVADRKEDKLFRVDKQGKTLKALDTPGYMPSGVAFDGKHLWVSDLEEGKIFRMSPEDGSVSRMLDSPTSKPTGLAWGKDGLWVVDEKEARLMRLDPMDGTVLQGFKAPSKASMGLAFDGRYLWVSDRKENLIHLVEPEHEAVVFSFKAPGPFSYGLASVGAELWNADYEKRKVYRLAADDGESFAASEPKKERLEVTSFILNYGPSRLRELKAWLAMPKDRENQKLLSMVELDPSPKGFVQDRYGQRFAVYEFQDVEAPGRREIKLKVDASLSEAVHYVFPHKVGKLSDIPKDVKELYLKDAVKFDLKNEFIQAKVKEAVGSETNPYWVARKLYDWLIAHMEYKLAGGWETAPQVLKRGHGSCSEYTFSYLALTRAAGIPSRYVGSYVVRNDDASWDDVFHRWAEIYLPGYGWIPVDANAGDKDEPHQQAKAFGSIENRFLITTEGGGDSEYMDWGYNLRQEWTAQGRTKVRVEDVAEWSPLP